MPRYAGTVKDAAAPKRKYNRKAVPIEPMEMDMAQPDALDLPSSGPIERVVTVIEPTSDTMSLGNKLDELKFNEEKVVIMIHESTDPNSSPIVEIGINGRMVYLERGRNYRISRKYVERLARAKTVGVRTVKAFDRDGSEITRIVQTSALSYPFSVIEDRNPLGASWLRNLLDQG